MRYYSTVVLGMAIAAVAAQEESSTDGSYYTNYFADSLSFEYDLQEHSNPDNNSNNLNLNRVSNYDL